MSLPALFTEIAWEGRFSSHVETRIKTLLNDNYGEDDNTVQCIQQFDS